MVFNKGVRCHPPQLSGLFRSPPVDHPGFRSNTFTNEASVISGYDKILNTVIYFTNFNKSFGITNTVSSDYILSSFFSSEMLNFPLFIDKHTDEHFWTDAPLPRDSMNFKVVYIGQHTPPQPIIDLQCTMERTNYSKHQWASTTLLVTPENLAGFRNRERSFLLRPLVEL